MKKDDYLDGKYLDEVHWSLILRSERLLEIISKYIDKNDSILELGCSSGRNLKYLYDAGYKNLTGLEMSKKAFDMIGSYTNKIFGRFEEKIEDLPISDVIISMSFLQEDLSHAKDKIAKIPSKVRKYLITIDNDDYEDIFLKNGLKKIEHINPSVESPFVTPIKVYEKLSS